jgi:hypothetical protein
MRIRRRILGRVTQRKADSCAFGGAYRLEDKTIPPWSENIAEGDDEQREDEAG